MFLRFWNNSYFCQTIHSHIDLLWNISMTTFGNILQWCKFRPENKRQKVVLVAWRLLDFILIQVRGKSVRSWCDWSSDRSFMVDPLSQFSFQPVHHHWCNKGRGMCYPVCGMMHIKEPLLLIGSDWSIHCLYNLFRECSWILMRWITCFFVSLSLL